ncbi:MAG: PHP domain-containing protein [Eubacterium sp.]|nr:PHP domain-containing protein [Eubacterium sp.]
MEYNIEELVNGYRMVFDYHTHTTYSHGFITPHGKGTVEENVQAAIDRGLEEIAISDHGPGHVFYGIKRNKIDDLRRDIEESQKKHPEIKIWMSCEANIVESGNNLDVSSEEAGKFDFLLGGYHYGVMNCHAVENWLLARRHYQEGGDNGLPIETSEAYEKQRMINTEMYIKTLRNNDLKILTHPGDKGPVDIREVAKVCAETDTWMEINTWHMHLTIEEIRIAMQEDVKFVISSDAHTPNRVGSYLKGLERALKAGLDPDRIVNIARK